MRTLLNDVRYATRTLSRQPGFALVAVLTLALGIGANTAIFSVIDAALLRSLPYREPGRLVHLWESKRNRDFEQREASYPDFLDWRAQGTEVFDGLAGYTPRAFTLADAGEATRPWGARSRSTARLTRSSACCPPTSTSRCSATRRSGRRSRRRPPWPRVVTS